MPLTRSQAHAWARFAATADAVTTAVVAGTFVVTGKPHSAAEVSLP